MRKYAKLFTVLLAMIFIAMHVAACGGAPQATEPASKANSETQTEKTEEPTEDTEEVTEDTEEDTDDEDDTEDGLDFSGMVDYEYEGLGFLVPEDFVETESNGTRMLVPSTYPDPSDNISLTVTDAPASAIDSYTEDALRNLFNATYRQLFNQEIQNYTYDRGEIPGAEFVIATFDIAEMEQVSVTFFFDGKAITVTFTNVSGDYVDAFVNGLSTFHVIK